MQIIIIVYLFFTTLGVTLMKLGGDTLSLIFKPGISFSIGYVTLAGFISYIISFILWQRIIINNNISTIFAITAGILQVLLFLIGIGFFKEEFKVVNLIGILFIITGIFFITHK